MWGGKIGEPRKMRIYKRWMGGGDSYCAPSRTPPRQQDYCIGNFESGLWDLGTTTVIMLLCFYVPISVFCTVLCIPHGSLYSGRFSVFCAMLLYSAPCFCILRLALYYVPYSVLCTIHCIMYHTLYFAMKFCCISVFGHRTLFFDTTLRTTHCIL